jgi:hypothetical protein
VAVRLAGRFFVAPCLPEQTPFLLEVVSSGRTWQVRGEKNATQGQAVAPRVLQVFAIKSFSEWPASQKKFTLNYLIRFEKSK